MTQIGGFDWDIATGSLAWSTGAEAAIGATPGSLGDIDTWQAIVEPDDRETLAATIAAARIDRPAWFAFRYRTRPAAGPGREIDGLAHCHYDKDGGLERILGVNIDATSRLRREAELLASEVRLRSILDTVPDAMLIADAAGIIQDASASAERMFGYEISDLLGRSLDTLLPPGEAGWAWQSLAKQRDTAPSLARRCDGSGFPINGFIGAAGAGNDELVTVFVRDVSERIAAEERLADMRHELFRVSRLDAMGELAAGLAHELNQPLGAAANYLGTASLLLRNAAPAARVTEAIDQAIAQTLRTGDIIRRMRSFIANGEAETIAVDVADIVDDAVTLMFVGGGQYDIVIRYDFAADATMVRADRIQIQQVLVNILRNAIEELKRCPGRRCIEIASRRCDAETVEISVADNGPGFDAAILPTLYSTFASTKARGHMGVGLSISRRIIEAHGGTIVAGNRAEGGAQVRFTLPAVAR